MQQPTCTAFHPLVPAGATAVELPFYYRPLFVKSFKRSGIFPAATVERLAPLPSERRAPRPGSAKVYFNQPTCDPDQEDDMQRVAYAFITPDTSPCRAEPGPFLCLVFRTLAVDLPQTFELLSPRYGADIGVRFRTHSLREAAMRRQPFRLDGATVELVPFRLINVAHAGNYYMAHITLHKYPVEQRSGEDAAENCNRFGSVRQIVVAEHDLSTVCVVLQVEHPREIPYELHIEYYNALFGCSELGSELAFWN